MSLESVVDGLGVILSPAGAGGDLKAHIPCTLAALSNGLESQRGQKQATGILLGLWGRRSFTSALELLEVSSGPRRGNVSL